MPSVGIRWLLKSVYGMLAIAAFCVARPGLAAVYYFESAGSTSSWTGTDWSTSSGGAPALNWPGNYGNGQSDSAVFPATTAVSVPTVWVQNLQVTGGNPALTLSGSSYLVPGLPPSAGSPVWTVNAGASLTIAGGSGINLNGNTTNPLVLQTNGNMTVNSFNSIGGVGSIIKQGSGNLTVTSPSTLNSVTVNGGTMTLPGGTNANFLPNTSNVTVGNGATLAFNGNNAFGIVPSAMTAVTVNAGGSVLSSNVTTVFNNLTLNGGTAGINGGDNYGPAWGSFAFAGTTTATGNAAIAPVGFGTGTISTGNGAASTFMVNTPASTDSLTISAPMQPSLALVKQGAGMLSLPGNNSLLGPITVSGGTLAFAGNSTQTSLGRIMPLGASFTYGVGGTNAGYRGPLFGLLTQAGYSFQYVGASNANPGSLPPAQQYHNGYNGWTTANVAVSIGSWLAAENPSAILLQVGTNDDLDGVPVATSVSNVGNSINTIESANPATQIYLAEIIPLPTPTPSQASWITQYNAGLGTLVIAKDAQGDHVTLVDMNSNYPAGAYADSVHPNNTGYNFMAQQWFNAIEAANPLVAVTGAPVSISSNATLAVSAGQQTIGPLSGGGNVVLGTSAVLTSVSPAYTYTAFSGVISGASGSLVKQGGGALVLTGTDTYGGGTTISAGTIQLGDGVYSNGAVQGNVIDQGTLVVANPAAQTFSGQISGSGNLYKTGAGSLVLTASSTYTGGTIVNSGTLILENENSIESGSTLIVGDASALPAGGIAAARSDVPQLSDFQPASGGNSVPEPGAAALIAAAVVVVLLVRRRWRV